MPADNRRARLCKFRSDELGLAQPGGFFRPLFEAKGTDARESRVLHGLAERDNTPVPVVLLVAVVHGVLSSALHIAESISPLVEFARASPCWRDPIVPTAPINRDRAGIR